MVININADNLELEESDSGSKIVNINAGGGDDKEITEEEEFIPDYDDYEDYDDDNIGVVSLRWVEELITCHVCDLYYCQSCINKNSLLSLLPVRRRS